MAEFKGNHSVKVNTYITMTLTLGEANALEAIIGYGVDSFLKVFYENMGKAYLQPFEKDIKDLFACRGALKSEISVLEKLHYEIAKTIRQVKSNPDPEMLK